MRRLPNNALQKALVKLLSDKLPDVTVYDFVPEAAQIPYVTLGACVTNDISTKTENLYKVDVQINIWSEYRGKYEINNIAERIARLLTSVEGYIDTTADNFAVYRQLVNQYEAFPENGEGYSGVLSLDIYIKNMEATPDDI